MEREAAPADPVEALRTLVGRLPQAQERDARIVETHISLLLLSGADVYKFKKPVLLPFADFRAAGERRRLCHAEVRLNRRLAPSLYRGVVRVTGDETRPRLGGRGRALAHAVHMHRFDSADEATAALADGRLDARALGDFGGRLANFHERAETLSPEAPLARPRDLRRAWGDDLLALASLAVGPRARVDALDASWQQAFERARRSIAARRRAGRVRACHGDLHLGNLVLLGGELTAFDCIEFNEEFRYIDVFNELAFLVMDLLHRSQWKLAMALLDGYLQVSADYGGLALLPVFAAYRASVRAKVAALRMTQLEAADERRAVRASVDAYLRLGTRLLEPPPAPALVLMHGVSGSGKSWLAQRLALAGGYLRVRSDVERRRLFDVQSARGRRRAYSVAGVRATYRLMRRHAGLALRAGLPVIADATFTDRAERRRFIELAAANGAGAAIVDLECPPDLLERRVAARVAAGDDVSQADVAVLRRQRATFEPLSPEEGCRRLTVASDAAIDPARLAARLARLTSQPRCTA